MKLEAINILNEGSWPMYWQAYGMVSAVKSHPSSKKTLSMRFSFNLISNNLNNTSEPKEDNHIRESGNKNFLY